MQSYVVWSPDTPACMAWPSHAHATRLARYWNESRLLGKSNWRVCALVAIPDAEGEPVAGSRTGPVRPVGAGHVAANDGRGQPSWIDPMDDAARDVLMATLRRRLEDAAAEAAKASATRDARIAELEARLAEFERSATSRPSVDRTAPG